MASRKRGGVVAVRGYRGPVDASGLPTPAPTGGGTITVRTASGALRTAYVPPQGAAGAGQVPVYVTPEIQEQISKYGKLIKTEKGPYGTIYYHEKGTVKPAPPPKQYATPDPLKYKTEYTMRYAETGRPYEKVGVDIKIINNKKIVETRYDVGGRVTKTTYDAVAEGGAGAYYDVEKFSQQLKESGFKKSGDQMYSYEAKTITQEPEKPAKGMGELLDKSGRVDLSTGRASTILSPFPVEPTPGAVLGILPLSPPPIPFIASEKEKVDYYAPKFAMGSGLASGPLVTGDLLAVTAPEVVSKAGSKLIEAPSEFPSYVGAGIAGAWETASAPMPTTPSMAFGQSLFTAGQVVGVSESVHAIGKGVDWGRTQVTKLRRTEVPASKILSKEVQRGRALPKLKGPKTRAARAEAQYKSAMSRHLAPPETKGQVGGYHVVHGGGKMKELVAQKGSLRGGHHEHFGTYLSTKGPYGGWIGSSGYEGGKISLNPLNYYKALKGWLHGKHTYWVAVKRVRKTPTAKPGQTIKGLKIGEAAATGLKPEYEIVVKELTPYSVTSDKYFFMYGGKPVSMTYLKAGGIAAKSSVKTMTEGQIAASEYSSGLYTPTPSYGSQFVGVSSIDMPLAESYTESLPSTIKPSLLYSSRKSPVPPSPAPSPSVTPRGSASPPPPIPPSSIPPPSRSPPPSVAAPVYTPTPVHYPPTAEVPVAAPPKLGIWFDDSVKRMKRIARKSRKYTQKYKPSIVGRYMGKTIAKAPARVVSEQIRYPLAKRKGPMARAGVFSAPKSRVFKPSKKKKIFFGRGKGFKPPAMPKRIGIFRKKRRRL